MASKGPKTGTAKPAVQKPAARVQKPVAPKAEIVAPAVEKPAPVPVAETIVPVVAEPVPAVAAAPQEVVETIEAVTEPVVEAVAEIPTTAAAVGQTAAETVKETVKMATTFENNTVENNSAKAQAFFADFNDRTKAAVEKSTKLVEEAGDFAKGNLEAVVESGRITAKGLETFGQEAAEYSRKSFETATAALKTMASVKSPADFFKLQSDFVRGAFDSYVAEASKNTEAMMKLAGDAAQPLSNRIAIAAEKVKTAA